MVVCVLEEKRRQAHNALAAAQRGENSDIKTIAKPRIVRSNPMMNGSSLLPKLLPLSASLEYACIAMGVGSEKSQAAKTTITRCMSSKTMKAEIPMIQLEKKDPSCQEMASCKTVSPTPAAAEMQPS